MNAQRLAGILVAAAALGACRNSDDNGVAGIKLVPSSFAANGCSGPDHVFTVGQTPAAGALTVLQIGPFSQLTAAGDSETLFATGDNATVVAIDVTAPIPVETEILAAGAVAALLLTQGIATAPVLSGISVLDSDSLLVVEHTSNTILKVDRHAVAAPEFFAGAPDEQGGFANGTALAVPNNPQARFHFRGPTQIAVSDPLVPFVFVADNGNHAVRRIASGFVITVAGGGAPFFDDGDIAGAGFDSPSGLSVTCSGTLLVSETGAAGVAGNRLRQLMLGPLSFFGQQGQVLTRAGNGVDATIQGDGELASLAAPVSPLTTAMGDTYWIDSTTGILRRMRGATDTCDCPLWTDCAFAVTAGGDFSPGGVVSLTQTPLGVMFVLDATAGQLLKVTP
ncbi:MAG TPA: hypothetical protein VK843_22655 [Planctomycetota bacterium]|nr:hypothetical protein [Planctomycetota bacterium]